MEKKIVKIELKTKEAKPYFKLKWPFELNIPKLPKPRWHFLTPSFKPQTLPLEAFRQLLSNQKAKILHLIKEKQPDSIYKLAKLLGRDFKSVRKDVEVLKQFGLVELVKTGKARKALKPKLCIESLDVRIEL